MKTLVLTVLVALALIIAACGSEESTPTSTGNPVPSAAGAKEVKVEVRSFSIQPETTALQPGQKVKFTASNTSSLLHTFTVATSNDKKEILVDLELNGGDSKSQEITVPSGAATLYYFCRPHESSGMNGTFNVGNAPAGAGSETKTPTSGQSGSDYY
ncbi:MAG: hypothetical protein FJ320_11485 [SAR202 cluster bacterium]|nr:hypothetical protein [SAR202 cluster bacterium]